MQRSNVLESSRNRLGSRAWPRVAHALAAWLLLSMPGSALAQGKPTEYDVKAAYLLNFGRFMRLAGTPQVARRATFDICILGHDPIGHVMDDLTASQSIGERAVHVVRVGDAYAARGCDIVFISADEGDGVIADLAALGKADALTVSDAPEFLKRGGMIQFVVKDKHVRFLVNLDAVNRTHLALSSELLRVALAVSGKPPSGDQP
jgi:hypothetical protein